MAPLSDYFPSFLLLISPLPTQVRIFYLKASARFPILERRAAKTIVWREQFHQHYCAHLIFYLLIITIITIGTFSPMQVIHAEREETNIQNWSVICHLVIKKNRERHGLRLKELKTHFPCTLVFFFQYEKKVSHKLNTVKLQCNYNPLLIYYLMSIAIKLEFSFKLSALSFFFFSISGHIKSRELLTTKSFRARNTAKSMALIFSGNMQVCCFPPEQSRSVQNSPLSLHLLPKVSLQQHFSIYLLSLVPRVFLFPSQKASGDGKRTERREREKLRVMFSQSFMINITILY